MVLRKPLRAAALFLALALLAIGGLYLAQRMDMTVTQSRSAYDAVSSATGLGRDSDIPSAPEPDSPDPDSK